MDIKRRSAVRRARILLGIVEIWEERRARTASLRWPFARALANGGVSPLVIRREFVRIVTDGLDRGALLSAGSAAARESAGRSRLFAGN